MKIEADSSERAASSPSFFKIMFGDFSTSICIPQAFVKHFHVVFPQEFVLTTCNGRGWNVCVIKVDNSLYFETGWSKFVQDKSLDLGDFLVFNYVRELEFNVSIFKKNGCEEGIKLATVKEENVVHFDNVCVDDEIKVSKPRNKIRGQDNFKPSCAKKGSAIAVANKFTSEHPFFKVVMTNTYTKSYFLHVPTSFVLEHKDIVSRDILLQVSNRKWPARVSSYGRTTFRISSGWSVFAKDNTLRENDVCIFELVKGYQILLKVTILRSIA